MSSDVKRFCLTAYGIAAVLTVVFETFIRLRACADTGGCTISLVKGFVWSIVWPAGWIVYLKGML
jgi:hypothetical protein